MKTLFVRIGTKAGPENFFRCGIEFTLAWQRVQVDKATADRLQAEQMLEVSDEQPDDFAEPVDPEADAAAKAAAEAEAAAKAAAEAEAAAKAAAEAEAAAKAASGKKK
jgi:hypothetical protein